MMVLTPYMSEGVGNKTCWWYALCVDFSSSSVLRVRAKQAIRKYLKNNASALEDSLEDWSLLSLQHYLNLTTRLS